MRITKLSIGVFFAFISTTSLMAQATQDTIKKNEAKNIEGVKLQGQRNKKPKRLFYKSRKKLLSKNKPWGLRRFPEKEFLI